MSDGIEQVVMAVVDALNEGHGVKKDEPGYSVVMIVVNPDGKVESTSNLPPDEYQRFMRFMFENTRTGDFSIEELGAETVQ